MGQVRGLTMKTKVTVSVLILIALAASEAAGSHLNPLVAPTAPWTTHLLEVEAALAQKDARSAERAWQEAYRAALGSMAWEGMIVVGEAARHISAARARRAYLIALIRARQQQSLEGVLRAAEAFASLGDREVVQSCLRIAAGLAVQPGDARVPARVRRLKERVEALWLVAAHSTDFQPSATVTDP